MVAPRGSLCCYLFRVGVARLCFSIELRNCCGRRRQQSNGLSTHIHLTVESLSGPLGVFFFILAVMVDVENTDRQDISGSIGSLPSRFLPRMLLQTGSTRSNLVVLSIYLVEFLCKREYQGSLPTLRPSYIYQGGRYERGCYFFSDPPIFFRILRSAVVYYNKKGHCVRGDVYDANTSRSKPARKRILWFDSGTPLCSKFSSERKNKT